MDGVPRGSDGRRLFTAEFKREQINRVLRGQVTVTELGRELGISRGLIQRWKHLATKGTGGGGRFERGCDPGGGTAASPGPNQGTGTPDG